MPQVEGGERITFTAVLHGRRRHVNDDQSQTLSKRKNSPEFPGAARSWRHRGKAFLVLLAASTTALVGVSAPAEAHGGHRGHGRDHGFTQVNLVSDLPGRAQLQRREGEEPVGHRLRPEDAAVGVEPGRATASLFTAAPRPTHAEGHQAGARGGGRLPDRHGLQPDRPVPDHPGWQDRSGELPVQREQGRSSATTPSPRWVPTEPRRFHPAAHDDGGEGEEARWVSTSASRSCPGTYRRRPPAAGGRRRSRAALSVYDSRFRPTNLGPRPSLDPRAAARPAGFAHVTYLKGRVYVGRPPPGR